MKARLTLAIVTRKRAGKLTRCLASITKQTKIPDTVLIVDNDDQGSARKVSARFNKQLPIKYVVEKREGIPQARDKALNLCQTPLLGYVDDDCVLDKRWVKEAKKSVSNSRAAFVLGRSELLNQDNLFAQAIFYRQDYWFNYELKKGGGIPTPFNLDTKNIVFKINDLKNKKISFDQELFIHSTGGHADTDLGFQLKRAALYGRYQSKLIVYHEEVDTIAGYIRKAYFRGKVGYLLSDKWNLEDEVVFLPDIKIIKGLKRLRTWPGDYRQWTKRIRNPTLRKVIIFLLIKVYDRVYLQGFVDQARKLGKGDIINQLIATDKR